MNLNKLAQSITIKEGQKKSVNIAQVKEVMKLMLRELSQMNILEVADILKKYK